MGIPQIVRLLALSAALVALGGCAMFTGPDWDRIGEIADKQLAAAKEFNEGVEQLTKPPSGNAGSQAHLAYQVRMASYQVNWDRFKPTVLNDVLSYVGQREGRQIQAAGLGLQALDMGLKYGVGGYGSGGGGNKVVFKGGNRKAGGNGEKGSASASGDTSFSDIYVTLDKSNGAWDSDRLAQGKDAQYQEGDGTQGQAISRPNNQHDLDFAGDGGSGDESPGAAGDNNIRSEGLGFDGSL
jgi:hypothetical protein